MSQGYSGNVLVGIDKFVFPVDFIVLDMPEDIKVPLILKRPFLSTAHAKMDVFKRKISLRVYALRLRERMELDLEARLMGEALILNGSPDPVYGDYIESNDLNKPLELRRNQVEDLGPTIEEGEVNNEPMEDIIKTRNDDNEIIIENMDAYRDEGMGDVIVGKPFCREICVKARRFDGMITIYNGLNTAYPEVWIWRIDFLYSLEFLGLCISVHVPASANHHNNGFADTFCELIQEQFYFGMHGLVGRGHDSSLGHVDHQICFGLLNIAINILCSHAICELVQEQIFLGLHSLAGCHHYSIIGHVRQQISFGLFNAARHILCSLVGYVGLGLNYGSKAMGEYVIYSIPRTIFNWFGDKLKNA
ncbi:hypothetical protein Tco_0347728 [Tanacetum coccineum]